MRCFWRRFLLATLPLAVFIFPHVSRAEVPLTQISPKLSVSGSLRIRTEMWHWFESRGPFNNDYVFASFLGRGAIKWKDDWFEGMLEAQNSSLLGLPDKAIAPAPQGNLGLGAVYFAHNRRSHDTGIFLKQAFVLFKNVAGLEGVTLKGGRFEFSEGNEVLTKEPTLDWLKNVRLSQRLIGPFGWSHVGRSFDGGVASLTRGPVNLTVMASHPTQGGFDLQGMKHMNEIDLFYMSLNLTRPSFAENTDARFFYIYYKDDRGLLKSDNRPLAVRQADTRHIDVHTQGGHIISVFPTRLGPIDTLAWGAMQQGDWGRLDHTAWTWNLELGWQPNLPWKPWLRIGYGRSSGDDNPRDGDHGTFFQLLPTSRIYSLSTFYNLMNSEDGFVQLILRPIPGLVSRTDFHNIRVVETRDLWYQGAGATLSDRNVWFSRTTSLWQAQFVSSDRNLSQLRPQQIYQP